MAAYEVLLLNTAIPQIQAAQSGDTYLCPRELAVVVNTATDAVRITQTGTGNALLVEDAANPDSTPFVVTAAGDVGIGTDSPGYKLDVISDANSFEGARIRNNDAGSSAYAGLILNAYGNSWSVRMGSVAANSNALQFVLDQLGSPSVKATLDSSGNLGLGVTPSAWSGLSPSLQMAYGSIYNAAFSVMGMSSVSYYNGGWKYYSTGQVPARYQMSQGNHEWYTAASGTAGDPITFTQAMTLDASGNLGIGTTSPSFTAGTGLQVYRTSGATVSIQDSSTNFDILSFSANVNLTNRSNGALVFGTNNTERARITSGGNLYVGDPSPATAGRIVADGGDAFYAGTFAQPSSASSCIAVHNRGTSGDNAFVIFGTEAAFTTRGSIDYNRTAGLVAYNTTSDYRAKDIIGPVANPGATIDALKVYEGKMKGATQSRPMLVAHEAQEHAPYAVTGEKDAVNEDGTPKYQQMDVSSLVPLLLAEIQSLRARVKALEGA